MKDLSLKVIILKNNIRDLEERLESFEEINCISEKNHYQLESIKVEKQGIKIVDTENKILLAISSAMVAFLLPFLSSMILQSKGYEATANFIILVITLIFLFKLFYKLNKLHRENLQKYTLIDGYLELLIERKKELEYLTK
ncbi:hypothetical protein [Oceanobacillus neutriphilus]|uniref:Uncharacterized protein n=1 Tax=Oceanobacillus neutriphilus TaxID=531815 RepID=A0ABQ2P2F0_9BACI|nr:hypothetical protein [Oceanobacillus neutriphilus]GGP16456.1 hypothetical protein GCM10011346_48490 [Oceanobacillus neutriphilus]